MMKNLHSRQATAAALLFVVVSVGFVVFGRDETKSAAGKVSAMTADIAVMQERIQADGAKGTYEKLSEEIKSLEYGKQHTTVHNFGAALYLEEGVDGLPVCDSRFSFGCFHEFLGRAIADLGMNSVNDLNQRCRDALGNESLSCQHGIGHGVLSSLGYERSHLDEALDVCKNMPFNDPIGGCYGGVFMEYNIRTMWGTDAKPREKLESAHEPCGGLAKEFQPACYFWQPQWWRQAYFSASKATEELYKKMGAHCAEIADVSIRLHCYEGIGNMTAPEVNFKAARAIEMCSAVSALKGPQILCRSVVANHLGIDVGKEEGESVCRGLPVDALEYCLQHAHNKLNIANRVELQYEI